MATDLAQLVKDIQQKASSLVPNNEHSRQSLLQSARSLVSRLESPGERIARSTYLEPSIYAAIRVLTDTKIFRILAENFNQPMSATQLAAESSMDVRLLERLLKHVATQDYVHETGPDEYTANDITHLLATREAEGVVREMYSFFDTLDMPSYFENNKYANPSSKDDNPWYKKKGVHYFDYIFAPGRERMAEDFHNHMRFKTLGPKWYEVPTIMDSLFKSQNFTSEDVVLVDVGGNTGHDILNFRTAHPTLPGRLILQDLPAAIQSVDTSALRAKNIEAHAHDFFTPQPIHGARVYYLKMVLHDWPDEQCRQILTSLKPGMKPGWSRILLNEIVIPEQGAGWFETSVDMLMMAVHGARERRESEWRALVEGVEGLRVRRVWDVEGAVEKVVEVELVGGGTE
ncbi:hypothetical protein LTR37_013584 [Vermiconidia calcicola]|uniref:Uncharacterized protein n=1 Tax=Vermiconidia calcicola TaxID=1690605 RepID=A0ACC3MWS7_9PEZI|nr:hypothetical protein LTR37_013584 [Vermiconidia calcicola]